MLVTRTQRTKRTLRLARTPKSLRIRKSTPGGRESRRANFAFPAEVVEYGVQGEDVSEPAESRDPAYHHVPDQGLLPEGFPAREVAQVDLRGGNPRVDQGVADRHARMRVPPGVDHQSVRVSPGVLEPGHDLPLVVGLEKRNGRPLSPGSLGHIPSDFSQGFPPVHPGLPLPQDIEVRSVDEKDPVRLPKGRPPPCLPGCIPPPRLPRPGGGDGGRGTRGSPGRGRQRLSRARGGAWRRMRARVSG